MRILHYFPGLRLADGGVVRSIIDWCTVLAARGHEIILATFDSPDAPKDWDGSPGKPKIVWLPGSSIANWKVPAEAVEMFERLLTPGSVVHLHTPWMASNMQMSRVCRNHGVPYVVSIHGMLDDWSMAQRGGLPAIHRRRRARSGAEVGSRGAADDLSADHRPQSLSATHFAGVGAQEIFD
jgi:glycosyltransferase involved in cell wall biosynthesis